MNPQDAIKKAVSLFPSRAAFARKLGVSAEAVRKWETNGVTARNYSKIVERAIEIQRITDGRVTVRELMPDMPDRSFFS